MVTYGRHPFIRLVSTYKDKVIDHIDFKHWRNFVNYDPTHPYEVKCPNMLNTASGSGANIITIYYIGPKTRLTIFLAGTKMKQFTLCRYGV